MEVFIGNLSPNTTRAELLAFFRAFNGKATFRIEEKKLEDGTSARYAIADFENDKYALKMIEKYNGKELHGRELVIREYYHRTYVNERRAVNWREKPWRAGERRKDDRRHKEAQEAHDDFEDILASSQAKEESLDKKAAQLKVQAYRDMARKS
jgi:RNA recognition motif-containing protein